MSTRCASLIHNPAMSTDKKTKGKGKDKGKDGKGKDKGKGKESKDGISKDGKELDNHGKKQPVKDKFRAQHDEAVARFAAMDVSEILADTMTNGKGKGKDGKGKDKDKGKGKDKGKDGKGKDKGKGKDRQGKGGGGAKDRSCQRTWKLILGNTVRKCYTFQFPKVFLKL